MKMTRVSAYDEIPVKGKLYLHRQPQVDSTQMAWMRRMAEKDKDRYRVIHSWFLREMVGNEVDIEKDVQFQLGFIFVHDDHTGERLLIGKFPFLSTMTTVDSWVVYCEKQILFPVDVARRIANALTMTIEKEFAGGLPRYGRPPTITTPRTPTVIGGPTVARGPGRRYESRITPMCPLSVSNKS